MTLDSIITMIVILGGVWGGFAILIVGVMRRERRPSDY